jgi:hypothetical protein
VYNFSLKPSCDFPSLAGLKEPIRFTIIFDLGKDEGGGLFFAARGGKSSTASKISFSIQILRFQRLTTKFLSSLSHIELAIMGISRDSRHKRSASGAKRAYYRAYHT